MTFALVLTIAICIALSARVLSLEGKLRDWQVEATELKQQFTKQNEAKLELVHALSKKAVSLDAVFCAVDILIQVEDFLSEYVEQLEEFENTNAKDKSNVILTLHNLAKEIASSEVKLSLKAAEYAKQSVDSKALHSVAYARIQLSQALLEVQEGRDELAKRLK